MRVADLEVDLRPVERRVPHSPLVGLAHRFERLGQRRLRIPPLLFGAQPFVLDVIAGRQLV